MATVISNETALTIFSLGIGVASGVGAIVLSNKLRKNKSTEQSSVILATIVVSLITIASVYLIQTSGQEPEGIPAP